MINTNEVLIHTINIRGDYPCNKLYARKIWEALYRHAGGKDFKSFDNFLIDLRCFEEQLDKQVGEASAVFYWVYWNGNHTSTWVFTPEENYRLIDNWDACHMVVLSWDKQTVEFFKIEVLGDE